MKKIVSLTLCLLLILGSISVSVASAATEMSLKQAIEIYEKNSGETVNTKRYYFLMPDGSNGILGTEEDYMYGEYAKSWYNENAEAAGVYWWGTDKVDPDFPGFKMMKGDSDSVYYADVPDFVNEMMFNNYFNGGNDFSEAVWYDQCQTTILSTEGYEENESDIYREGLDSFENMIYVINPSFHSINDLEPQRTWGGEWYYYYGNGCFGTFKNGNEHFCIRADHDHENLYIKFDPRNSSWTDFNNVYCIIQSQTGSQYYPEKSIPTLCTDYDGDGVYTYDLNKSKINLKKNGIYYVHFVTDTGNRTYELTMQTSNIGDTVLITGEGQNRTLTKWKNEVPIYIPSLTNSIKDYEKANDIEIQTYRNYFLIPDGSDNFIDSTGQVLPNWFNEYSTDICVNWYSYDKTGDVPYRYYPGYTINQTLIDNIYYADIPVGVNAYTLNNGVVDYQYPTYSRCVSSLLGPEYNSEYREGLTDCDNMIFVLEEMDWWSATTTAMCHGQWYYYRGGGCYSDTKTGDCLNKAHNHKSVKEAVAEYETETGKTVETNRYYFLMPDGTNGEKGDDGDSGTYGKFATSWYNEYSDAPAIYWWYQESINPDTYPGYSVEKGDSDSVFYADVPKEVTTIIWNNNITHASTYDHLRPYISQTINIPCEYYDPGESPNYPQGTDNFDEMIFVVDPDYVSINDIGFGNTGGGEWYYYYGNGCYGFQANGNESNCIRDDHDHANTDVDNKIYFDTNKVKWDDVSQIYCHIYDEDGNYFFNYASKKEKCLDTNNDSVWTYDLSRVDITLEKDKV
ncbi:MAG: hypothetical protein Q4A12_05675, partial [Eubacteriales bacterium]|nr:hypothetical protein [Eubacteriales bacterium]